MKLQRQHFLLSYFKILSVDTAGVRTRDLPGPDAQPTEPPVVKSVKACFHEYHLTVELFLQTVLSQNLQSWSPMTMMTFVAILDKCKKKYRHPK